MMVWFLAAVMVVAAVMGRVFPGYGAAMVAYGAPA